MPGNRVGGGLATPVLPHHRTYLRIRRFLKTFQVAKAAQGSFLIDAAETDNSSSLEVPVPPSLP
jgi:hypothetical protein